MMPILPFLFLGWYLHLLELILVQIFLINSRMIVSKKKPAIVLLVEHVVRGDLAKSSGSNLIATVNIQC